MNPDIDTTDSEKKKQRHLLEKDQDRLSVAFYALQRKEKRMRKPYYKLLDKHLILVNTIQKSLDALEKVQKELDVTTHDINVDIRTLLFLGDLGSPFDDIIIIDDDENKNLLQCIRDIYDGKDNALIAEYPAIADYIRHRYAFSIPRVAEYRWSTELYANPRSKRVWAHDIVIWIDKRPNKPAEMVMRSKSFDARALPYGDVTTTQTKDGYRDTKSAPVNVICLTAKIV
jgi:hypothetical protein